MKPTACKAEKSHIKKSLSNANEISKVKIAFMQYGSNPIFKKFLFFKNFNLEFLLSNQFDKNKLVIIRNIVIVTSIGSLSSLQFRLPTMGALVGG